MQPEEKPLTPPAEIAEDRQPASGAQTHVGAGNSLDGTKPSLTGKVKSIVQDFVDYAKNTDL